MQSVSKGIFAVQYGTEEAGAAGRRHLHRVASHGVTGVADCVGITEKLQQQQSQGGMPTAGGFRRVYYAISAAAAEGNLALEVSTARPTTYRGRAQCQVYIRFILLHARIPSYNRRHARCMLCLEIKVKVVVQDGNRILLPQSAFATIASEEQSLSKEQVTQPRMTICVITTLRTTESRHTLTRMVCCSLWVFISSRLMALTRFLIKSLIICAFVKQNKRLRCNCKPHITQYILVLVPN